MDPSKLALKGSSKIVADYFEFAINTILFQRGIYPPEDFHTVRKYGLPMLLTSDDDVRSYIDSIMAQVRKWIYGGKINRLVVVIVLRLTAEAVEKWQFNVEVTVGGADARGGGEATAASAAGADASAPSAVGADASAPSALASATPVPAPKPVAETQREIQALVRQITSSGSYLPMLREDEYTFNVLVHTDPRDSHVPREWAEGSDGALAGNVEQVQFRSFSTSIHHIGTQVSYKHET